MRQTPTFTVCFTRYLTSWRENWRKNPALQNIINRYRYPVCSRLLSNTDTYPSRSSSSESESSTGVVVVVTFLAPGTPVVAAGLAWLGGLASTCGLANTCGTRPEVLTPWGRRLLLLSAASLWMLKMLGGFFSSPVSGTDVLKKAFLLDRKESTNNSAKQNFPPFLKEQLDQLFAQFISAILQCCGCGSKLNPHSGLWI